MAVSITTQSKVTVSIMTQSKVTVSITTQSKVTVSITTLSIMTFSITMIKHNTQHNSNVVMPMVVYAECHYAECHFLNCRGGVLTVLFHFNCFVKFFHFPIKKHKTFYSVFP